MAGRAVGLFSPGWDIHLTQSLFLWEAHNRARVRVRLGARLRGTRREVWFGSGGSLPGLNWGPNRFLFVSPQSSQSAERCLAHSRRLIGARGIAKNWGEEAAWLKGVHS